MRGQAAIWREGAAGADAGGKARAEADLLRRQLDARGAELDAARDAAAAAAAERGRLVQVPACGGPGSWHCPASSMCSLLLLMLILLPRRRWRWLRLCKARGSRVDLR